MGDKDFIKIAKDSRAWQLVKGIAILIIGTALSSLFNLNILNPISRFSYIFNSFTAFPPPLYPAARSYCNERTVNVY